MHVISAEAAVPRATVGAKHLHALGSSVPKIRCTHFRYNIKHYIRVLWYVRQILVQIILLIYMREGTCAAGLCAGGCQCGAQYVPVAGRDLRKRAGAVDSPATGRRPLGRARRCLHCDRGACVHCRCLPTFHFDEHVRGRWCGMAK